MSGDILDQIDHVLADYDTGPDAMRWTPEQQEETGPQVMFGGVDITDHVRSIALPGAAWTVDDELHRFDHAVLEAHFTVDLRYTRGELRSARIARIFGIPQRMVHDGPRPLAVDGAAYRRRQKARRRRR